MYMRVHSPTTTLTIRVPKPLKDRLDKLSEATARTCSWLAADALQSYVHDHEWQLEAVREGKKQMKSGQLIPHKAVDRWLSTWGTKQELPPPSWK